MLVTVASRTCLIVADLLAIGVTWHATYHTTQLISNLQQSAHKDRQTLSEIMLQDGMLLVYTCKTSKLQLNICYNQEQYTLCKNYALLCFTAMFKV